MLGYGLWAVAPTAGASGHSLQSAVVRANVV